MSRATKLLEELHPHKALPLLRKAAPSFANTVNLAIALRGVGKIDEAVTKLRTLLPEYKERAEVWNNLGQCATDLGDFASAPKMFQNALMCVEKEGLPPHSAHEPLLGFAYAMMRLGHFKDTWPIWEAARYNHTWHPFPALHRWQGEAGARLLVLPEGGFGDAINFLRWVPRGSGVIVWDPLYEFAKHVIGDFCRVYPMSHQFEFAELAQYTHCAPYLSLMMPMRQWSDIPTALPWVPAGSIHAPANDWIGFCWRAEENGVMRRIRSLGILAASRVSKHLHENCFRVVSLCPRGKSLYRKDDFTVPLHVTQDEAQLATWEETARTIMRCKLVVTVDTAVAHLAGSLGVPTLCVVPLRSDWKWGLPPETKTPWYGLNFRLFRNMHPLDWDVAGICQAVDRM
jgi:hypothetical protein